MPNFDITYSPAIGIDVTAGGPARIVVATIGGALLKYMLESAGTPPGIAGPLPAGFHLLIADHFAGVLPDAYGTALVDWTAFSSIDQDSIVAVQIEDPGSTVADPCPTLTSWALELGGTVQGTQANP